MKTNDSPRISLRISRELLAAIERQAGDSPIGPIIRSALCKAFGVADEPLLQGFAAAGQPKKSRKKKSRKIP